MIPVRARLGTATDDLAAISVRPTTDPHVTELEGMIAEVDKLAAEVARLASASAGRPRAAPRAEPASEVSKRDPVVNHMVEPIILPPCTANAKLFVRGSEAVLQLELARKTVPLLIPLEIGALENLRIAVAHAIETILREEIGGDR